MQSAASHIHVLVLPDFNLAATMAFIDPFRAANYLDGVPLFRWRFVSAEGGPVRASNGAVIMTEALDQVRNAAPEMLIVAASWDPSAHVSARIRALLQQAAGRQVTLGGLDTGAFVLAQAGLLDGYRATVHYEHIDAFQELYPDVTVTETLWVFDGPRITCCGGAAAGEFGLQIVQARLGPARANAAARYLFLADIRDDTAPQNPQSREPLGATVPGALRRAIKTMEAHLEAPLDIPQIAGQIGISHRQLNRLFAQHVGKTPALYYRDIRLDRARGLVTQTSLSMAEIAIASGFASQVHFSRAYKSRFGLPPRQDRKDGRVPFEFRAWPMHQKPPDMSG